MTQENLEADVANMKFDAGVGEDPFAKVKGSITGLVCQLQDECSSEVNQKACFNEETSKATDKEDLDADTAKHSSTLETAVFRYATLDVEISTLQSELRVLSKRQLHMVAESVSEGHPDKICDQVSDVMIDAYLSCDTKCKVACEACVKDNMFTVTGEITVAGKTNHETIVRGVVPNIGFESLIDDLRLRGTVSRQQTEHQHCRQCAC